jgi:hypothetical protein
MLVKQINRIRTAFCCPRQVKFKLTLSLSIEKASAHKVFSFNRPELRIMIMIAELDVCFLTGFAGFVQHFERAFNIIHCIDRRVGTN